MKYTDKPVSSTWTRRGLFKAGGATALGTLLTGGASKVALAEPTTLSDNIYTAAGVRPFINLTAAYTVYGGLLTLPSVKEAMEKASYYSVAIDELMQGVGARLGQLLGGEFGIVTAGCASAIGIATTGCVTGGDPEKIQRLPNVQDLKDHVLFPVQSRNEYDHAARGVGVKAVNFDSKQELLASLGPRTAMIYVLGEKPGRVPLEEIAAAAHQAGVPVLVDAAAEVPTLPNQYLKRGADMVAISGGKYLAGPQCSGILLGRRDLVQAAWVCSAPHHGLCRTMKVGKEEIMGLLAAVETFVHERSYPRELEAWNSWLTTIRDSVLTVPGVRAVLHPPESPNPHPYLLIQWSPDEIPMTGGELHQRMLDGNPRVMTLAGGDTYAFRARAGAMKPGDDKLVASRLQEVFSEARRQKKKVLAQPAEDVAGKWNVAIKFFASSARHTFDLQTDGNQVRGTHRGEFKQSDLVGTVDGRNIRLRSQFPCDGFTLPYLFTGSVSQAGMSGELDLDELGHATWSARRA